MPRIAHRGFARAILAVTAAAGLAAWIVLSSSASKPPAAEDVAVTTAQQRELLQRGSVRASIVTRGATTVALRAELGPGPDAPGVVVASRNVHVDGAGRHGVKLDLTPDGRLAARSCTPLVLTVSLSAARSAARSLAADRARCPRGAESRPQRPAGRSWKPGTPPVDPRQQTALEFGDRSHWLQPWKAYMETPPVSRLLDAPGMNFFVDADEADATARLLRASGFRRARLEIGWSRLAFADAGRLENPREWEVKLRALRRHDLRPLVLLNANHQQPTPVRRDNVVLRADAPAGARSVLLVPGSRALVRPGRSGFGGLGSDRAAEVLITRVAADGRATLSRPLPQALPRGEREVTTLSHPPFGVPGSAGFERTLSGWLRYVGTVTRFVRRVYGSWDFDVEIWNELTFGSDFLRPQAYYDPAPKGAGGDEKISRELLRRSVAWLRDSDNDIGPIGIGDGFANQTPFAAGSTSPPGLTAIDKHPYAASKRFPRDAEPSQFRPLDARGEPDGVRVGQNKIRDRFAPRYNAFFPEYFLTAIQTETMIRDLSPISTDLKGIRHGRSTAPPSGKPPQLWITEVALDPRGADLSTPGAKGKRPELRPREIERLKAVASLRYLTAFSHKGVRAIDFYAAKDDALGLVSQRFFDQLVQSGGRFPGVGTGGLTMDVMRRLTGTIRGAETTQAQPLTLTEVAGAGAGRQFAGDGTARHPDLTNADVVTFLPFQRGRGAWVAPVYVMTRDMSRPLGAESFRLTIRGVDPGRAAVSLYDPLSGRFAAAAVTGRDASAIVVELGLTDAPRLLFIDEK